MFLLAGASRNRVQCLIAVGAIGGYAAIQFYLGVRHEAAILAVEAAWVWHRVIRPVRPVVLVAAAAFLVGVVFPLVGAIRNTSGKDRSTLEFLTENYVSIDNPLVASISEMGGSMETVAHTLNFVPAERDYEMGVGYAYAVSTLFPNLFWKIHPAMEHELPSSWLTWLVDPYTASQGGGRGFSFIAEAYFELWLRRRANRTVRHRLLPEQARPLDRRGDATRSRGLRRHGGLLRDLPGACRIGGRTAGSGLVLDWTLPRNGLVDASPHCAGARTRPIRFAWRAAGTVDWLFVAGLSSSIGNN